MPVSADTVQFSYLGDGSTTVFPFPSRFLSNSDIIVGVNGAQVLSGFTVSGAGGPSGGNVTFTVAPVVGAQITLIRAPAISQLLDFVNNATVLAENIDNGLDKLTIISQYLDYLIERTLRLSQFDTALSGNYDLQGKKVVNSGAASGLNDLTRLADVQAILSSAGNVPSPLGSQVGFLLRALSTGTFGWAEAPAGRNLIMNGQGRINQRGYVSGTSTPAIPEYMLDRWRKSAATGGLTFTGGDHRREMTMFGGAGIGFSQTVEGANVLSGTYVINWTGTANCYVNATPRAKGETFTLPAGVNVEVSFGGDGSGSGTTFTDVQLERGTIPTPFEYLPYGTELARCQRYFYAAPSVTATTTLYTDAARALMFWRRMTFPVAMRTAPVAAVVGTPTYTNCSNLSISGNALDWAERLDTTAAGPYRATGYSVNFDAEF